MTDFDPTPKISDRAQSSAGAAYAWPHPEWSKMDRAQKHWAIMGREDLIWLCEGQGDGEHAELVCGWSAIVRHYATHAVDYDVPPEAMAEAASIFEDVQGWEFGSNGTASLGFSFEDGGLSYTLVTDLGPLATPTPDDCAALALATRRHTHDGADLYDGEREALLRVEKAPVAGVEPSGNAGQLAATCKDGLQVAVPGAAGQADAVASGLPPGYWVMPHDPLRLCTPDGFFVDWSKPDYVRAFAAALAQARAVLRQVEWSATSRHVGFAPAPACPCCGGIVGPEGAFPGVVGHAPDCALAAQLDTDTGRTVETRQDGPAPAADTGGGHGT